MKAKDKEIYRFEYDRWNLVEPTDLKAMDIICITHTAPVPDTVSLELASAKTGIGTDSSNHSFRCFNYTYVIWETTDIASNEKCLIPVSFEVLEVDPEGFFEDLLDPHTCAGIKQYHYSGLRSEGFPQAKRSDLKKLKHIAAFFKSPIIHGVLAEFEDETFMFTDLYYGKGQVYSPRLTLLELEKWCEKNLHIYKEIEFGVDFNRLNIDDEPLFEITPWWH